MLKLHLENSRKRTVELIFEYGFQNYQQKFEDFVAFGKIPFSVIGYHNEIIREVQTAFVAGAYYPALVASCTLGERILNEIIYDLKDDFKDRPTYSHVDRKEWLQNWEIAVRTLIDWGIIKTSLRDAFDDLRASRTLAVHFHNYEDALRRDRALEAIRTIVKIVTEIFGVDGGRYWMLRGIKGAFFIAKEYEDDPFVKKYLIPRSNLVGPYYSIEFDEGKMITIDYPDYPASEISDEEFAKLYSERKPEQLARRAAGDNN